MNYFIIEHIMRIENKFSMSGEALLESLQDKLSRDQYRKCCFLMRTQPAVTEDILISQVDTFRSTQFDYVGSLDIYRFLKQIGFSVDEIYSLWMINRTSHCERRLNLKAMKHPPKQDNKDITIGSGGSNKNKIRYPKKCRKTAWKRFYKLFPNLKP